MAELLGTIERQARLVDWAALASPYLGIRGFSMSLAGSDAPHLIEFDRQAEAYRYALIESLNKVHMNQVPLARDLEAADPRFGAPSRLRIDRAFLENLPAFSYRTPTARWALAGRGTGIAAALASTIVLAGLLVWTTTRRAMAS